MEFDEDAFLFGEVQNGRSVDFALGELHALLNGGSDMTFNRYLAIGFANCGINYSEWRKGYTYRAESARIFFTLGVHKNEQNRDERNIR